MKKPKYTYTLIYINILAPPPPNSSLSMTLQDDIQRHEKLPKQAYRQCSGGLSPPGDNIWRPWQHPVVLLLSQNQVVQKEKLPLHQSSLHADNRGRQCVVCEPVTGHRKSFVTSTRFHIQERDCVPNLGRSLEMSQYHFSVPHCTTQFLPAFYPREESRRHPALFHLSARISIRGSSNAHF